MKGSHSVLSNCLWPIVLQLPRLLCPWDSPGKNTGAGSHSLLQGIFLTQELNLGLLHFRQILYCLNHQGIPWEELENYYHPNTVDLPVLIKIQNRMRNQDIVNFLFEGGWNILNSYIPEGCSGKGRKTKQSSKDTIVSLSGTREAPALGLHI